VVFDKNLPNTFKNVTIQVAFLFFLKEGGTMAVQLEDSLLNFSEDFKGQDLVEESGDIEVDHILNGERGDFAFAVKGQQIAFILDEESDFGFLLSIKSVQFPTSTEEDFEITIQATSFTTGEVFTFTFSNTFFVRGQQLVCETKFNPETDILEFPMICCEVMTHKDFEEQGLDEKDDYQCALNYLKKHRYILLFEVE